LFLETAIFNGQAISQTTEIVYLVELLMLLQNSSTVYFGTQVQRVDKQCSHMLIFMTGYFTTALL
jgi:hypothetical protein